MKFHHCNGNEQCTLKCCKFGHVPLNRTPKFLQLLAADFVENLHAYSTPVGILGIMPAQNALAFWEFWMKGSLGILGRFGTFKLKGTLGTLGPQNWEFWAL